MLRQPCDLHSRRSQEILSRLGALEAFTKKGLPWTGGRSYYRDKEVLHFAMPHDENQKLPPMLNIEQFYIEQFLLDQAERRADLIDIRWATRVIDVTARNDGALLSLSSKSGDYSIDADWVIAADGGRSQMRERLGLELKGNSYEGRYVIVDITLDTDLPTERLAWFDPPSNPGSSILMHRQPDGIWRVDYQIGKHEDADEAVKPENVIPRVQSHLDMIGQKGKWAPIWIAMYKAHALTLDKYRHGRVLFAGDAAHLLPIFGVRGANSGIDDADNLAWKLAYVIDGLAEDALLDSYSDERVFAAHENLSFGTKSTEFMAPPSFAYELMRTAVLTLATDHPEVRSLINPRQSSTITYRDSPLNVLDQDAASFSVGPVPGAALVECPIEVWDGTRLSAAYLTDLIRPLFTLLAFAETADEFADAARIQSEMKQRRIPFQTLTICARRPGQGHGAAAWDVTGRLFKMYGATTGSCYLVRPDGHVLGRWRQLDRQSVTEAILSALHRNSGQVQ